jgi:hypothetical protein
MSSIRLTDQQTPLDIACEVPSVDYPKWEP